MRIIHGGIRRPAWVWGRHSCTACGCLFEVEEGDGFTVLRLDTADLAGLSCPFCHAVVLVQEPAWSRVARREAV